MSVQTNLTTALNEIDRASGIVEFSTAVVTRDKQLCKADLPVFLQQAAVEFQSRFLPSFEESIRAEKSWGLCHDMQCGEPKGWRSGGAGYLRENSFSRVAAGPCSDEKDRYQSAFRICGIIRQARQESGLSPWGGPNSQILLRGKQIASRIEQSQPGRADKRLQQVAGRE
ncbi:hypothetical protein [Bradyrhizobium embrapense]